MEDGSEAESRGKSRASTPPPNVHDSKTAKILEFPLTLLQSQPKCEVYPDLHRIIQVLSEVGQDKNINPLVLISHFKVVCLFILIIHVPC